jgi:hypothetical protein
MSLARPAISHRTRTVQRQLFIRWCRISRTVKIFNVTVKNFLTVAVLFDEKYRKMNETGNTITFKSYH